MTFIYKPKKGLKGKAYDWFMKRIVCSEYVDRFIIFSSQEADYYSSVFGVPKDRFHYMKYVVADEYEKYRDEITTTNKYLAAGRSNRDYDFLTSVWNENDPPLEIICDVYSYKGKENIICYNDCRDEAYLKKIAQCYAVIMPFYDENISAGQMVALHAMMLGKPVICTKSATITDYVEPDETALMIVKDSDELHKAMAKLSDQTFYKKMADNARNFFVNNYREDAFAENIGEIISCETREKVNEKENEV